MIARARRPLATFEISRVQLASMAAPPRQPSDPERDRARILEEIRAAFPGQAIAHGIDRHGCYARIGDVEARARDVNAALSDALAMARS